MLENSPWDSDFGSIFKTRYNREAIEKYKGDLEKGKPGLLTAAGGIAGGLMAGPMGAVAGVGAGHAADDAFGNSADGDEIENAEDGTVIDSNETVEPTVKSLRKGDSSDLNEEAFLAEKLGDKSGLSPAELRRGQANKHRVHAIPADKPYPKSQRELDTQKSLRKAIKSLDAFLAKAKPKSMPKPKNIKMKGANHG